MNKRMKRLNIKQQPKQLIKEGSNPITLSYKKDYLTDLLDRLQKPHN